MAELMSSILPPSATALERQIEAVSSRLDYLPVIVRDLWDVETCPAAYLPWLAWAFSVDIWEAGWPDRTKRDVIAASVEVHRKKGTAGAVRRALAATGVPSEIVEWWEEGGAPHTFRILVDVAALVARGRAFNAALIAEIRDSVIAAKPVRSHFAISAYYGVSGGLFVGGALIVSQRVSIPPYLPTSFELTADLPVAAVLVTNTRLEMQ